MCVSTLIFVVVVLSVCVMVFIYLRDLQLFASQGFHSEGSGELEIRGPSDPREGYAEDLRKCALKLH